ncbi:MAG: zinc ABC transporter substrate-binding protein [Patescibacteria group bacterium]
MSRTSLLAGVGILVVGIVTLVLSWGGPEPTIETGRLRVIATFFPLYDFARAVGKDKIELSLLFTATPEVASFTPRDIQKINRADVVVKNGLGLEPVLDELIAASDNKNVTVVDTSVGISSLNTDEGADPHIWLNPQNAIVQIGNIRDALVVADPANAASYTGNAAAYIAKLQELDRDIGASVAQFSRKDFVAFHSAFRYFAERYGLRQVAVIEEFPGKEPSPAYIADVIRIIRATGLKTIFAEPQFSPRIVEVIARDLGLTVYTLDPVETGDPVRDSYISLMRHNMETLKRAMQ